MGKHIYYGDVFAIWSIPAFIHCFSFFLPSLFVSDNDFKMNLICLPLYQDLFSQLTFNIQNLMDKLFQRSETQLGVRRHIFLYSYSNFYLFIYFAFFINSINLF